MFLKDLLKGRLPETKLSLIPNGFEVIGKIAIFNIPPQLDDDKYLIAEALASHRKDIQTVLRKVYKIRGEKRVGEFEFLAGSSTETIHRENGCAFHVDMLSVYFSGKMAYERNRIAQKVIDGEDVLVVFCGAGPFLIPMKKSKQAAVTGLDSNPAACRLLRQNLTLNGVDANIILADARSLNNLFKKPFDRIVMPTPYGQDRFLDIAETALKPGGTIHFYTFKKDFEIAHFTRLLEERGWEVDFYRDCGNVARRVKRYVFDLKKRDPGACLSNKAGTLAGDAMP